MVGRIWKAFNGRRLSFVRRRLVFAAVGPQRWNQVLGFALQRSLPQKTLSRGEKVEKFAQILSARISSPRYQVIVSDWKIGTPPFGEELEAGIAAKPALCRDRVP